MNIEMLKAGAEDFVNTTLRKEVFSYEKQEDKKYFIYVIGSELNVATVFEGAIFIRDYLIDICFDNDIDDCLFDDSIGEIVKDICIGLNKYIAFAE